MANKVGELYVRIGASIEGFTRSMDQAQRKMAETDQRLDVIGRRIMHGVSAAFAAAGAAAFAAGNQMEEATSTIRAGTGATGDALKSLQKDFREVWKTGPEGAEVVSQVVADLNTRLGLTGESLQRVSRQMLDLADLTGGNVVSMVASVTRAFGDWNVETEKQADTLDMFYRASQSTGIGIDELTRKLVQYGAPLRQMGFDMTQAIALFSKWEKQGVNAELVMGSLRIALIKFAKEGVKDNSAAFAELTERIKNATSASEAIAIASEYFGARAGADMAAAIRENRFELGELIPVLTDTTETIEKADKESETFAERMKMLKNRVMEALVPVGRIGGSLLMAAATALQAVYYLKGLNVALTLTAVKARAAAVAVSIFNGALQFLNKHPVIRIITLIAAALLAVYFAARKVGEWLGWWGPEADDAAVHLEKLQKQLEGLNETAAEMGDTGDMTLGAPKFDDAAEAEKRLWEIRHRNADELKQLQMEMERDLAGVPGDAAQARMAIEQDYADRRRALIQRQGQEELEARKQLEEQAAALREQASQQWIAQAQERNARIAENFKTEREALLSFSSQKLKDAGRAYDAERLMARAEHQARMQDLLAAAAAGEGVRYRQLDSEIKLQAALTDVNRRETEARIEMQRREAQAADDTRNKVLQMSQDFVQKLNSGRQAAVRVMEDASLRLVRLIEGETAARLLSLDRQRTAERAAIEESILDAKLRADALEALETSYALQKQEIFAEEAEQHQDRMGWDQDLKAGLTDTVSLWRRAMEGTANINVTRQLAVQHAGVMAADPEASRKLTEIARALERANQMEMESKETLHSIRRALEE